MAQIFTLCIILSLCSLVSGLQLKQIRKVVVGVAAGISIGSNFPAAVIPTANAVVAADSSLVIAKAKQESTSIADIGVDMLGKNEPIGKYLGKKATLIVNVASQCALTPQYEGLVNLYDKYVMKG